MRPPILIVLYPFRYRDPLTKKWVRARDVATVDEIAARYREWEIAGRPELREARACYAHFSPFKREQEREGQKRRWAIVGIAS